MKIVALRNFWLTKVRTKKLSTARSSSSTQQSNGAGEGSCRSSNANNEPMLICTFGPGPDSIDEQWRTTAEHYVAKWRSLFYPNRACGSRAYTLCGSLADLQDALVEHAYDTISTNFSEDNIEFLEVEDVLPRSTTRACGVMQQPDAHPIQYSVPGVTVEEYENWLKLQKQKRLFEEPDDLGYCLSGTAEMGIAHYLKGRTFVESELPAYFCAESRCFRPEISKSVTESGLYRVHEFTKLEIFAVCVEQQSHFVLDHIVAAQRSILEPLLLHCRLLKMPSEDLGPAANCKFDIEAWMPGRRAWGELTSASNCTDYQSRRLGIRYRPSDDASSNAHRFVHTCNGTAMATSRTLIAVLETHQRKKGRMELPNAIRCRIPSSPEPLRMQKAPAFVYNFDEDQ